MRVAILAGGRGTRLQDETVSRPKPMVIPGTIRSLIRGQQPVIRSDGEFVRDYFYVEDGAAAYMLLAEQLSENELLRGEAFNFSYEEPRTVLEVTDILLDLFSSRVRPRLLRNASHEIRAQDLSASKARQRLGWEPIYSLRDGLQHTIDWYLAKFNAPPIDRRLAG